MLLRRNLRIFFYIVLPALLPIILFGWYGFWAAVAAFIVIGIINGNTDSKTVTVLSIIATVSAGIFLIFPAAVVLGLPGAFIAQGWLYRGVYLLICVLIIE